MEKEFYITSTISIMAKSKEEADKILWNEQNDIQTDITDILIRNAEVKEA